MRRSLDVSRDGAAFGADLGSSSKHSFEKHVYSDEDRAEKGSSSTAVERGLIDPKPKARAFLFRNPTRVNLYGAKEIIISLPIRNKLPVTEDRAEDVDVSPGKS